MLENVPLQNMTTMKVGGKARFFVSVKNESELLEAVDFAKNKDLPIFVLGGGSNVVISDRGFEGLVIKNEILGIEQIESSSEFVRVKVGAGESWDSFVETAVGMGLYGLENLSLIPGTVGAAPVQNIGAYGVEVKDVPISVRALNLDTRELSVLNNEECQFSYRNSIFKQDKNFIITSVEFTLSKKGQLSLSYRDLQTSVNESGADVERLSPADVRDMVIEIRKRKLPDPQVIPTAGSFFKNPEISGEHFDRLLKRFPLMPGFRLNTGGVKVPLAWIIENVANLKGVRYGGAAIYDKHALVIVNTGKAEAKEIYELSQQVYDSVLELTGIKIETEVQFIGDFN